MYRVCGIKNIYNVILLNYKKEWNNAIFRKMDGPRDYCTKWSKSKTNIIWDHLYVESKIKKKKMTQMNLLTEQKQTQIQKTNLRLPKKIGDGY